MNSKNLDSTLPSSTEVLMVGFGPVGAALSALLGRYGIKTLVVDKVKDIVLMPRAIALDNEALRILQMVGLTEESFARIRIPGVKMHCPYLGQFAYANTTGTIDCHPKLVTFYQPDLERALREQVGQSQCITVCTGFELVNLLQSNNGVTAILKDEQGELHEVNASYLVGADGASSKVRTLIGQDFHGQTYAEDWLIVDARQREGKAIDHVEFICDPKRPTPHMPAPGGRERWEFMLQPGETREEMEKVEKVSELLSPWIRPDELVIERKAVYRFHARCCDSFQKGRVFLVGDAAHITPPFVGQGLVAGLRDVANLGWKLAWVIRGHAAPSLLDSYDQERRPHARKMIELAKFMGHLVMPRNAPMAVIAHGMMRFARFIPPLRKHLEELKIKPVNRFKEGFFVASGSRSKLSHGGQISQDLVRQGNRICLSDEVLGDDMTIVGFGINPRQVLDEDTIRLWEARNGRFLHIGMKGERSFENPIFVEDIGGTLLPMAPTGWIAIIRPDRVIVDSGLSSETKAMVCRCLAVFDGITSLRDVMPT